MEEMGFAAIKFPEMRRELIGYLRGLSDLEYQRKCWVLKECPYNIQNDEFDYVVHFLFDDTQLSSNSEGLVGYLLYNKEEAIAVGLVCESIDELLTKHGYSKTDEEYISLSDWKKVLEYAAHALKVLQQNG